MTVKRIVDEVAAYYGIDAEGLMLGGRHRRVSEPRHVAIYLAHIILGMDNNELAVQFGKTRVLCLYAVKKVAAWVEEPRFNRRAAACVADVLEVTDKVGAKKR